MTYHRLGKVLIANRGEIALRIQRACHKLGLQTVSIASEADKNALFARRADELVIIGPPPSRDSYLNMDRIIAVARERGCGAVHPGYGFLSENFQFCKRVREAGLIFIGPNPESIEVMGQKTAAKERVRAHQVPCAPSSPGELSDEALLRESQNIGFPLLIKAVAGGGGRGMRVARSEQELKEALPRARAEAQKFFSCGDVYLEKFIENPRHVEVQIFGDSYGTILHFGTRDCSTQRRHQKIIEEAPAPNLAPTLREEIHQAAIRAAKSVNYVNAGTVEFLVKDEQFFFLEMNTRIQVEHPVTEAITGVDLVELQLRVAAGEKLPFTQEQVRFNGHAIEFRINAEDPEKNFLPATGTLTKINRPVFSQLREDFGVEQGDEIPLFYDSLISKIIVHSTSRAAAISKSQNILKSYVIEGVPTSLDYQIWLLYNKVFRQGPVDIGFVEREFPNEFRRQVNALKVRDGSWQSPRGGSKGNGSETGAEVKNLYKYTSKKFQTTYTIEVLHQRDGVFVAAPVDTEGRRAKNMNCRMSNGLDAAMKSLIDDVLEVKPPAEVFAELH